MTATLETPTDTEKVVETPTPVIGETPPPLSTEDTDVLVNSLLNPKVEGNPDKPKQPVKEKAVKAEKPADDKEINFANLRKKAEEAEKTVKQHEADFAKLREEYDTFKKNPVPKEFAEKLTAAEKRAQEADDRASRADLNDSPSFQAQYQPGIQEAAGIMVEELKELGIDSKEINSAIASWNKEQFAEWADSMPSLSRDRFLRAHTEAVNLDARRTRALADHRATRTKLEEQSKAEQQQTQKQYFDGLKAERNSVFSEIESTHKELLADADIRRQTEEVLDRAIGADGKGLSTREMLSTLASTHVLAHHFKKVDADRTRLTEELAAAKKTLEERDAFIKSVNGSTPVPSGTAPNNSQADVDAMVNSLLHPVIGV